MIRVCLRSAGSAALGVIVATVIWNVVTDRADRRGDT